MYDGLHHPCRRCPWTHDGPLDARRKLGPANASWSPDFSIFCGAVLRGPASGYPALRPCRPRAPPPFDAPQCRRGDRWGRDLRLDSRTHCTAYGAPNHDDFANGPRRRVARVRVLFESGQAGSGEPRPCRFARTLRPKPAAPSPLRPPALPSNLWTSIAGFALPGTW